MRVEIGQLEAGTDRLAELNGDEVEIALALETDFEALAAEQPLRARGGLLP